MKFARTVLSTLSATALGLSVLCLTAAPAQATPTSITTSFNVNANVLASCTVSATDLAFGSYNGALLNNTSTITATCTNTTSYTITLSAGAGTAPVASVTTRHMMMGAQELNYALFYDSSRTKNWGMTVGTDTPAAALGNGAGQVITVYGQIAAAQLVTPGTYSDSITATLTY